MCVWYVCVCVCVCEVCIYVCVCGGMCPCLVTSQHLETTTPLSSWDGEFPIVVMYVFSLPHRTQREESGVEVGKRI